MSLLDRTGGGQGASHLDDLDGLIAVADLHPDAATFEAWLREAFHAERDPRASPCRRSTGSRVASGTTLPCSASSTASRPHRLADDLEEERRVLHVGITRGRRRVAVLADRSRRHHSSTSSTARRPSAHRRGSPARTPPSEPPRRDAVPIDVELSVDAVAAEKALRDWRAMRAKVDEVPAYVVLNDRHLRGIAVAKPRDAAELAACDGIGPTKLERYGDQILDVLSAL